MTAATTTSSALVGGVAMRSRVSAIRPRAARVVVAARASSSAPRRACLRAANASTRRRDRVVARMGFFDNLFKKKDGDGDGENDGDDDAAADASASSSAPASSAPATASPAANEDPGPPVAAQRVEYQSLKSMPKATDTLSALDALLGESEEEKARKAQDAADEAAYEASKTAAAKKKAEIAAAVMASADEKDGGASSAGDDDDDGGGVNVSISPNALKALRDAERARATGGEKDAATDEAATDEKDGAVDAREETLSAVVDVLSSSAKKDRDERTKEENEKLDQVLKDLNDLTKMSKEERDSAEVKAKFESLFEILDVDVSPTMSKEDVKRLKDEVFGYNTFYVTGTSELGEELGVSEGVLVKGNLRADRAEVWKTVQENVERVYEGKYTVFMLEEPPADFFGDDDDGGSGAGASMSGSYDASDPTNTRGPRISFLIVPASKAGPNPRTSAFQYVVAIALFGLTAGSALQLGLVAEVSRLPQATMDWLAAGSQGIDTSLAPGELPPGLDGFDSAAYIAGAVPIAGGIYASAAAHEIGHWIAAATKKIKLSIPYPIPNGQLGTFGSITQIKSLPENRTDLYDVSVAGPIGGFTVASALFFYGLALSAGGGDPNELLPIPNELFQGSLMLGAISEAILGGTADQVKGVAVHPLFIAGWCVRFGFGRSGRSSSRRTEAVFFSRPLARASCPRTTTHHIDLTVARCYPPALKSAGDFCRTALGGTLP